MPRFEIVPGLQFVSRDTWGARAELPRLGRRVARSRRTHVIAHHTVLGDTGDQSPNLWESLPEIYKNMRRLQVVRADDLGADVPYNFVAFLFRNGGLVICEGRGEDRGGAHTKGHNTAGIGIAFAGNFDERSLPGIELARRAHLFSAFLGWLRNDPSHPDYGTFPRMRNLGSVRPGDRSIFVHRDFKATACPGRFMLAHLPHVGFLDPRDLA